MDEEKNILPWEKPRIRKILEIIGGSVIEVKSIKVRRDTNNETIQR